MANCLNLKMDQMSMVENGHAFGPISLDHQQHSGLDLSMMTVMEQERESMSLLYYHFQPALN